MVNCATGKIPDLPLSEDIWVEQMRQNLRVLLIFRVFLLAEVETKTKRWIRTKRFFVTSNRQLKRNPEEENASN